MPKRTLTQELQNDLRPPLLYNTVSMLCNKISSKTKWTILHLRLETIQIQNPATRHSMLNKTSSDSKKPILTLPCSAYQQISFGQLKKKQGNQKLHSWRLTDQYNNFKKQSPFLLVSVHELQNNIWNRCL